MKTKILKPSDYIESLIRDTWSDKIIWEIFDNEYGTRYIYKHPVSNSKYLKVEIFSAGVFSYIETKYIINLNKQIDFETIKYVDYKEQMLRLKLAIKRQIDAKIAIKR